jgi:hypothetical protein
VGEREKESRGAEPLVKKKMFINFLKNWGDNNKPRDMYCGFTSTHTTPSFQIGDYDWCELCELMSRVVCSVSNKSESQYTECSAVKPTVLENRTDTVITEGGGFRFCSPLLPTSICWNWLSTGTGAQAH